MGSQMVLRSANSRRPGSRIDAVDRLLPSCSVGNNAPPLTHWQTKHFGRSNQDINLRIRASEPDRRFSSLLSTGAESFLTPLHQDDS